MSGSKRPTAPALERANARGQSLVLTLNALVSKVTIMAVLKALQLLRKERESETSKAKAKAFHTH